MSHFIQPPMKIVIPEPEKLLLSSSITGTRGNYAATEKAVGLLRELVMADIFPVGSPIPCPTDELPNNNYFFMKGQAFDSIENPILASIYGTHLDDMRGLTIAGKLDSETVRAYLAGQIKSHGHSGYASSSYVGNKTTEAAGNHRHSISAQWNDGTGSYVDGSASHNGRTYYTGYEGEHTHSIDLGAHAHSVTVNATGGAKNTVDRRLFNWIVRKG